MFVMLKLYIFSALLISIVYSAPSKFDALEDIASCLKDFYQVAYTGDYSCTKKYDFFSNDPVTQKDAFTNGKDCFFSVIKEECTKSQYSLLAKKYDQIAETITEKPENGTSCIDLHYTYNAQKCTPMMKDFGQKTMMIAFDRPKMNDPQLLDVINLCGKIQNCMSPTCYYPEESKKQVNSSCEAFKMLNSPFSDCMASLQTHPPRSSKYSCLHGRDFNAPGIETGIEMLTIYKKCTKEIMKASCGDEAVENFDVYAKISVDALQKMKAMTGSFYGK